MRDRTDRPEGVRAGCAVLAGTDPSRVSFHINRLLDDPQARLRAGENPYGDGGAAERIADRIALELVGGDSSRTRRFRRPDEAVPVEISA
jgi:UDP-N-acetylglucosamine 2-epimerase (non-hydrolysing)